MAINFGILQPIDIAGKIAAGQQEAQRNQLAQQQLSMGGLQQQKAELELGDFRRRQAGLDSFIQKSRAAKKSGSEEDMLNSYEEYGLEVGDPQHIMNAQELRLAFNERKAYMGGGQQPQPVTAAPSASNLPAYDRTGDSLFARQAALETPVTANAPFVETRNLPARGEALPFATPVDNNLIPAAAPVESVNQLGVPAARSPADIQARIIYLNQFPRVPAAKAEIAMLTKELEESRKLYTVGGNLVTGAGKSIFTAADKVTPSEIGKLIAERKALVDKNPQDPNIAVYDQKIKDEGLARDRLNFDKQVQQWKVNHPGYSIQQDENGYLVGVDPNTLQGTYVTFGQPSAGGGKAGKPGVFPAANVQGKPSVLPPAAAVQAAPGVAPAVPTDGMPVSDNRMKGKSTGLTEGQSNAAMFGSAMAQAQQVFNQAEKEGTTTGAGTVNLAQGIVKYVPLGIGDKLVNDIYALAVNDPTKLFGPDINQQKIGQAQLAFSIAYLRKTSGANFGPSEVANTIMEYFPSVGEDKSVVKQKAESRKRAIAGMKISAGSEGKKFIEGYEAPSSGAAGTVASDPLGLFPAKK